MAFDTRGWRKLIRADRVFYWQPADDEWGEVFRVRPERDPHCLLRITSPWCGGRAALDGVVKPGAVRAALDWATDRG